MRYLSADVGGTFTDLVLYDTEAGRSYVEKVPSRQRGSAQSIIEGAERILATAGLKPGDLDLFVHGFTVATNAFLMRTGAKVALIVTEGFRDVLEIGDQLRPKLYALHQTRPDPVTRRNEVVTLNERISAFGEVVVPLEDAEIAQAVEAVAALEPQAIAVCLTFAHLNPAHERRLAAALAERLPNLPIYISSEVNPQIGEYPRANTTAIAAFVGPITDRYLAELEQGLTDAGVSAPLRLMRSDGGVATPRSARANPANMLLSGPAGGVVAGVELGRGLGVRDLITFDMGGTSADFAPIVAGQARRIQQRSLDGQPLRLPMLDIDTISAGGGSIGWVDKAGGLRVGPQSAGSVPGPASYGRGGVEPTITDAAVVLGLLAPEDYLGGEVPLSIEAAREAVRSHLAEPLGLSVQAASLGMIRVANARMAQAIRSLSVERGLDVRRFALMAFGGAGPLFSSWLADMLDMAEVIVPRYPGVFAAEGLLMGDIRHSLQQPWRSRLQAVDPDSMSAQLTLLAQQLDGELAADGVVASGRRFSFSADMRHVGQFHELDLELPAPGNAGWWDPSALTQAFLAEHERLYGHADGSCPIEIVTLRVEGIGAIDRPSLPANVRDRQDSVTSYGDRRLLLDEAAGPVVCPLYARSDLSHGALLQGPCLVTQRDSTALVLPGQVAEVATGGVLRIRRAEKEESDAGL